MNTTIIKKTVASYFGKMPGDFDIKCREPDICFPRQIAHYFAWEFKVGKLTEIGLRIGNMNHTTVLHSHKTIKNLIETNYKYQGEPLVKIIDSLNLLIHANGNREKPHVYKSVFCWQGLKHISQKALIANI